MGGKRKPAQRTKNNVRPSSSGRSAELLNSSPSMLLDVSRFSENSVLPLIIPGVSPLGASSFESNISPEYQLVVKKMKKKDSITRYKALQEFVQLLEKSDLEEIKIILPVWSRLYSTLALDIDHKVRDVCQEAHRIIVNKAGRNIAPSLKQLIGPWFLSAFDSFHPAAQKAALSFEQAFVPSKRTEALLFCHLEILSFIEENVIIHTPSTLSNPGICPMDEMVAKYERVVVASLNAYAQLLEKIPKDALKENQEIHEQKLVSSNAFWIYPTHKNYQIRKAWFGVIISVCQHAPYLLSDQVKRVCSIVFQHLNDNNSTVLPSVWDAALELMVAYDNWWEHVNFNSKVLPKLWSVLLSGAHGNAVHIYPKLLPFLSKVPPPEKEEWYHDFYLKFFRSMIDGLLERSGQQSAVESKAVINALFECLQYVCKIQMKNIDLCLALFHNQIFPLLESALLDEFLKNINDVVFTQMSNLLHHWQKLEITGTPNSTYTIIIKECWKHLTEVSKKPFISLPLDEWKFSNQLKLLTALNDSFSHGSRESSQALKDNLEAPTKPDAGNTIDEFFEKHLGKFISSLIHQYYTSLETPTPDSYVTKVHLCKILTLFDSKRVFQYLLDCFKNDGCTDSDSFLKLWNCLFNRWLYNDEAPTDLVLHLWCVLLKHVNEDDKVKILTEILDYSLPKLIQILYWCFFVDIKHETLETVAFWAKQKRFQSIIISISKNLTRINLDESPEELDRKCQVLSKLISPQEKKIFITGATFSEILENFNSDLQYCIQSSDAAACDIKSLAQLVDLTVVAFSNSAMVSTAITAEVVKGIILNVFRLCCLSNIISNQEVLRTLKFSWQQGLNLLFKFYPSCKAPGITHLAEEHAKCVVDILTSFNPKNIKNLTDLTVSYITSSIDFVKSDDGVAESSSFCRYLCDLFVETAINRCKTHLEEKILNLCLFSEFINGKFDSVVDLQKLNSIIQEINLGCADSAAETMGKSALLSKNQFNLISCGDVKNFGNVITYIVSLILRFMNILPDLALYDHQEEDGSDHMNSQASLPENGFEVTTPVFYCLYGVEVCKSFKNNFTNTPASYSLTEEVMDYLVTNLQLIVSKLTKAQFLELLSVIRSEQKLNSFIFSDLVLSTLDTENQFKSEDVNKQLDILSSVTNTSSLDVSLLRTVNSCLLSEAFDYDTKRKTVSSVMGLLIESKKSITYTYAANLIDLTPEQIELPSCTCKFLNLVLRQVGSNNDNGFCPLTEVESDFLLISLTAWIQSLSKTMECISLDPSYDVRVPIFISEICCLFESVSHVVNTFHPEDSFSAEWRELFMADVHLLIANAWKCLVQNSSKLVKTVQTYFIVKKLSNLLINVVKFDLVIKDDSDLRKWSKFALNNLENSSNIYVQLTSYYILRALIPAYIKYDSNVIAEREADEEIDKKDPKIVFNWFESSLDHSQSIVCMMLSDLKLGDICSVAPLTDSYSFTLAYLSLWSVIFEMVAQADSQLRYQYTFWIRDENLIPNLMPNMIRLLPASIVHTNMHDANRKRLQRSFKGEETLLTNEQWDSTKLSSIVCLTYCNALRRLPALIRQWWTEVDNKEARVVEDVTSRYVSSMLCEEELKAIREANKKPMENFIIKIRDSVREVIATYTVEDIAMEVSITLAQNHPLGQVRVESTKAAMSSQHWHNWLKQLTIFLTHQNGSIWDGLMSWKSNIDKRFEGVEECYICFSILHVTSYELPRKNCRTCHKKFHLHCLYKWFMTSNKSTCPTCRNLF